MRMAFAAGVAPRHPFGHPTRFSACGNPGGAHRAGATFPAGVAPNRPAAKRSSYDAPTSHATRSPGERDPSGPTHFTAGHATADQHHDAVPGVEREPNDQLPIGSGGPGFPKPPSPLWTRPECLRGVGWVHDGRQLDHDQQHLLAVPCSRNAQHGMPCRSVWRDRPAAHLLVHRHGVVEPMDPVQHQLRSLPSAFPTSRNPAGHHGGGLPGGPNRIAHVAGRAAADEDWDIQLPGHHVGAAQPDIHVMDRLGGHWRSEGRDKHLRPSGPSVFDRKQQRHAGRQRRLLQHLLLLGRVLGRLLGQPPRQWNAGVWRLQRGRQRRVDTVPVGRPSATGGHVYRKRLAEWLGIGDARILGMGRIQVGEAPPLLSSIMRRRRITRPGCFSEGRWLGHLRRLLGSSLLCLEVKPQPRFSTSPCPGLREPTRIAVDPNWSRLAAAPARPRWLGNDHQKPRPR